MQVRTTRFGILNVETHDLVSFPAGLIGLEDCRRWVMLSDAANDALGWLQSIDRPETALAVVSPRRFVPDYRFRTFKNELAPLQLTTMEEAQVLVVVARHDGRLTANLRAPIVVNVRARLGRQVIANDDHPLQYSLPAPSSQLKKSA